MANIQRCQQGTEAACRTTNALVSKALVYPQVGSHVGGGLHVNMPPTWDGQGATPPGWTKQAVSVYLVDALTAALPLPDDLVALVNAAPAQARLTGLERAAFATTVLGRALVDLDAYLPEVVSMAAASQV